MGKCVKDETHYWCNGSCQSVNLSCSGLCHPSHKFKCPKIDFCTSTRHVQCKNPTLDFNTNACPGFKEQCETTQTECGLNGLG